MTAPDGGPSAIRDCLEDAVRRGRTPGAQYVAVDATHVLAACAAGVADVRHATPMTLATSMMAYSMSKTITAVAVLQLVEAGRVDLDAPVARVLDDLPYGDRVTTRQLLAHTAGLPNPIPLRWVHPAADDASFDERAALAAVLRAHPRLARTPGSRYAYSNIGYWLLGAVVERAAGAPFAAYVAERICQPLGLTPAQLGFTIGNRAHHATGYLERRSIANLLGRWLFDRALLGDREGAWRRIGDHYPNGRAFGGVIGTASAFAVFLQDQLRPDSRVLGAAGRRLLTEQQHTRDGTPVPMTLGWHVATIDGRTCLFKEGGGGGFHCEMRLYPARGLGSVLMTNATGVDVKSCLTSLDRALPG